MRYLPLLMLLAACTPTSKDTGASDSGTPDASCSTESYWTGGNEESPNMNPGEDCIACHNRGEGPDYTLAGTVMGDYDDPDDCNGIEDVVVRVTDADGVTTELTTNSAGNFFTRDDIAMPYTVVIDRDGETREMVAEQSTGACGSCHTANGAEGAPGRVVAP